MTFDHYMLLGLLGLPLVGGIVVACLGGQRGALVRAVALTASLATLSLALIVTGRFMALDRTNIGKDATGKTLAAPTFQPEFVPGSDPDNPYAANPHSTSWEIVQVGGGAIQFYIGVDGLSIWLVLLTAVLLLPAVLVSWTHVSERVNEFYAWLLVLQTCMMGVFLSFDIVLFYVFFELTLVPLFFLIGVWGGPQRQFAARKFFLYTLTGSLFTLLGVLAVLQACVERTGVMTFSIPALVDAVHSQLEEARTDPEAQQYWWRVQLLAFTLLSLGFAVKVPLVPFHTWLPLAHVEAPTAGSVDLAGVLLKVGAYGFLRLCIPLAPDVSLTLGLPLVTLLAAIGIVYGAFCAFAQEDVKRLIAYSSVSHLGLCMLGMFSLNVAGLSGSLMQMINHGLSTAGLFLLIGMIYERYHTRKLGDYGGMATRMPLFAVFLVFMCLSSAGLPGLNGFIGEALCLSGIMQHEWQAGRLVLTAVGASGMILGAWYLFTMTRRLLFGPVKEPATGEHHVGDLKPREWLLLAPIVVLCVVIGVYPQPILTTARPDLETVARIAELARNRQHLAATGSTAAALNP